MTGAQQPPLAGSNSWLGTEEFADLAGITVQAARRALRRGSKGEAWRGQPIVVRHQYGRGGRAGLAYQVAFESLPDVLRFSERVCGAEAIEPGAATSGRRAANNQSAAIAERWAAIRDAVEHPRSSVLRAAAVVASAARTGRSERTLYRWIEQHEAHGLRGLARAQATSAGAPRVIVSRRFDDAMRSAGYADDVIGDVAIGVKASLKGLWASRAEQAGWNEVRRLAEFLLFEACEARNLAVERSALRLSRRCVDASSRSSPRAGVPPSTVRGDVRPMQRIPARGWRARGGWGRHLRLPVGRRDHNHGS